MEKFASSRFLHGAVPAFLLPVDRLLHSIQALIPAGSGKDRLNKEIARPVIAHRFPSLKIHSPAGNKKNTNGQRSSCPWNRTFYFPENNFLARRQTGRPH